MKTTKVASPQNLDTLQSKQQEKRQSLTPERPRNSCSSRRNNIRKRCNIYKNKTKNRNNSSRKKKQKKQRKEAKTRIRHGGGGNASATLFIFKENQGGGRGREKTVEVRVSRSRAMVKIRPCFAKGPRWYYVLSKARSLFSSPARDPSPNSLHLLRQFNVHSLTSHVHCVPALSHHGKEKEEIFSSALTTFAEWTERNKRTFPIGKRAISAAV